MVVCKVLVIVSLALLGVTNAQVNFNGSCPDDVTVIPNFILEKYLGTWYEYAKYPAIFEAGGKCISAQYTLKIDGNVGVTNSMIYEMTGATNEIVGFAKPIDNAKLLVTFPVSPAYNATSNYWVLDTDYTTYSVVYSCQPTGEAQHATIVWILTRERQVSVDVVEKAKSVLVKNGISLQELLLTDQTGCNQAISAPQVE